MELKDLTVEQLKALAYDQVCVLTVTERNLKLIENEIAKRAPKLDTPPVE
jgi:hypothetical protein